MQLHIPGLLTADELATVRRQLVSAPWGDGRNTAGSQARQAKNNQQLAPRSEITRTLQPLVLMAVQRHALFFSAAMPKRVMPPLFNRYSGSSNAYGNHVDQAIRYPEGVERLRTDLSCTLFLSGPDEYAGGEMVIDEPYGLPGVKLPAGDLLLYPGNSVHRVEPVTRGARLASFFWVESLVRSHEQRRLLFDLDMNLMRLRQRHGDSDESVALTGTYHNLLRLWAET